jgi:hypothetical protein
MNCGGDADPDNAGAYGLLDHGDVGVYVVQLADLQGHDHVDDAHHANEYVDAPSFHDCADAHDVRLNGATLPIPSTWPQ